MEPDRGDGDRLLPLPPPSRYLGRRSIASAKRWADVDLAADAEVGVAPPAKGAAQPLAGGWLAGWYRRVAAGNAVTYSVT